MSMSVNNDSSSLMFTAVTENTYRPYRGAVINQFLCFIFLEHFKDFFFTQFTNLCSCTTGRHYASSTKSTG
jgi:hypothetical protein